MSDRARSDSLGQREGQGGHGTMQPSRAVLGRVEITEDDLLTPLERLRPEDLQCQVALIRFGRQVG